MFILIFNSKYQGFIGFYGGEEYIFV